jgi:hypothetical protein
MSEPLRNPKACSGIIQRNRRHWALAVLSGWVLLAGGACTLFANGENALPAGSAGLSAREKSIGDNAQATLSELAWLEGKWQGSWGPRIAEQAWMAPRAGQMVGLFREVENMTLVVELYSLVEAPDGIELRLRHFTPSLVTWEESNSTMLKLVSVDPKTAVFENRSEGQPKRYTLIRVDADNYVSRVEIASGEESGRVTEIHYHRQK